MSTIVYKIRRKCCQHEASTTLLVHSAYLPHMRKLCENQKMLVNLTEIWVSHSTHILGHSMNMAAVFPP